MPDNKKTQKPQNKCRLTLINEASLPDCAKLFLDVFVNEPWKYTWMTLGNATRYFEDLFKTPKFLGFYYEQNGQIIGVCAGVVNDYFSQKVYEIKEIFIHTNMQNMGIGSALLHEIESVLSSRKINAVSLFTHRHIAAYDFYRKNGYFQSDETVYLCKPLIQ